MSAFHFKQFSVSHDRSPMRVGTDGVLIGAWACVEGRRNALDVGTGCGLIALMLAQRSEQIHVTGIDIDHGAAADARENADQSPWSHRIDIVQADFTTHDFGGRTYDLIVSNPPFHTEALRSPDAARALARHAVSLDFPTLLGRSAQLLATDGEIDLIVPAWADTMLTDAGAAAGLSPIRTTRVFSRTGKPCRRVMMAFMHSNEVVDRMCHVDEMCITDDAGQYTDEYIRLTRDFYLYM